MFARACLLLGFQILVYVGCGLAAIIPDTTKEKPLQGEVLAVGQGTKDEEMVLKASDQVLYGKYAGTEVEVDGEKYIIMRQRDVLAVQG